MTIKEKLVEYIKYKGISQRRFTEIIGVSYGYINAMRVSIQPDVLQRIATHFPDLNIEWLYIGRGSMIRKEEQSFSESKLESESEEITQEAFYNLTKTVLSQQETIDKLLKEIKKKSVQDGQNMNSSRDKFGTKTDKKEQI